MGGRRSSPGSAAVEPAPDPADDFTPQQSKFIDELLADPEQNGTRAAMKAYPSQSWNTAKATACENLAKPHIAAEIKRRLAPAVAKARMSRDRVLAVVGDGLNWDPADAYNADGSFKAIRDMPPDVRRQIAGIDIEEIKAGQLVIGHTKKVRFLNRNESVQMAARVHKLLVDKVEVQGATGRADRLRRARERAGK